MTKTARTIKVAVFLAFTTWAVLYFLNIYFNLPGFNTEFNYKPLYFISLLPLSGMFGLITNLSIQVNWVFIFIAISWATMIVFRRLFATNYYKCLFRFELALLAIVSIHVIYYFVLDSPLFVLLIWLIIAWMSISVFAMFISFKYLEVAPYIQSEKIFVTKADHTELMIKLQLPNWYRWIPFNWGSTKMDITYGVEGHKKNFTTNGILKETIISVREDFSYKGHYKFGVYEIKLTDTLGIISKKIKFKLSDVKIYPEVSSVKNKMNFAFDGDDEAMKQLIRKGEMFDTREMLPGDSMKRINWKMFAKKGDMFVRHEEVSSFVGARTIFYDNRLNFDSSEQKMIDEKMTEVLVSTIDTFLLNKEEYKLLRFTNKDVHFEKYKLKRFKDLVDGISFIPFIKKISKSQLMKMKRNIQVISREGDVIIITSNPDKYIFEQCIGIKKVRGTPKVIYVVHNNKEVDNVDNFQKKLGVKVIKVNTRKNTSDYEGDIL